MNSTWFSVITIGAVLPILGSAVAVMRTRARERREQQRKPWDRGWLSHGAEAGVRPLATNPELVQACADGSHVAASGTVVGRTTRGSLGRVRSSRLYVERRRQHRRI